MYDFFQHLIELDLRFNQWFNEGNNGVFVSTAFGFNRIPAYVIFQITLVPRLIAVDYNSWREGKEFGLAIFFICLKIVISHPAPSIPAEKLEGDFPMIDFDPPTKETAARWCFNDACATVPNGYRITNRDELLNKFLEVMECIKIEEGEDEENKAARVRIS